MTFKTLTVAAVLALAPVLSVACPSYDREAQFCAAGSVWDDASQRCVEKGMS